MKTSILHGLTAIPLYIVLAVPAQMLPQQRSAEAVESNRIRYTIIDLGLLGGPPGQPYDINRAGLTTGAAASKDGAMHAALWFKQVKLDIGELGIGGPNNAAFGINGTSQVVGEAQTSERDYEDFCGFNAFGLPHSDNACLPFLWQGGQMTSLPTLGGANGVANKINEHGVVVGFAETKVQEHGCQVSDFKPVFWKNEKVHELPTFQGDPVGVAAWINDNGQIVGSSGSCAGFNPNSALYMVENHALLWKGGKVIDLKNLGGTGGIAGNHACAINNRGDVVGHSELANDSAFHGFLWTPESERMHDLGTLGTDPMSLALDINDGGTIVGASLDAGFNPRAVVWEQGAVKPLYKLVRGTSDLDLLLAAAINARGEIVGLGIAKGELHGFLAIRSYWDQHREADDAVADSAPEPPRTTLSENARQLLRQVLALRYHIALP